MAHELLAVIIHDVDDDELAPGDHAAIAASREYFRQGGRGLSLEQLATECGFTMDQIRGSRD